MCMLGACPCNRTNGTTKESYSRKVSENFHFANCSDQIISQRTPQNLRPDLIKKEQQEILGARTRASKHQEMLSLEELPRGQDPNCLHTYESIVPSHRNLGLNNLFSSLVHKTLSSCAYDEDTLHKDDQRQSSGIVNNTIVESDSSYMTSQHQA